MGILQNLANWFSPRPSSDIVNDGEHIWYHQGSPYIITQAGETVSLGNIKTIAAAFACTKALSETVAGLPALVYKEKAGKRVPDYNEAFDLLTVQPNNEMDAFTFWDLAIDRLVNAGNFFAEIQRDGQDRPIGLWPIHPSRVRPVRDTDDKSLYWEITNDYTGDPDYSDPSWRDRHVRFLSPHQMFNIVGTNTHNGVIATGVIPGAQDMGIELAARRYGSEFFDKGASLAGIVEHPGYYADPGQRNQFRSDLNAIHNKSRHQIGVLWSGATYKQISLSPEQAQFLETRKFTRQQVCEMYGVPPGIIGDYEHSKFATADAMIRAWVMITLRNLVTRVEKAVNRQILSVQTESGLRRSFGSNLWYEIDLNDLLRGDPKTQAEMWKIMREGGALSANEWREFAGMNSIEGEHGEYLIVPGGFTRLDKIDEQGDRMQNAALDQEEDTTGQDPAKEDSQNIKEMDSSDDQADATGHNPAIEATVESAFSVFQRIHKNTLNQAERWKQLDPEEVMTRTEQFADKQGERLEEALQPVTKIAYAAGVWLSAGKVAYDYSALLKSLDYAGWFSLESIEEVVHDYLKEEIRCE